MNADRVNGGIPSRFEKCHGNSVEKPILISFRVKFFAEPLLRMTCQSEILNFKDVEGSK